jgi:ankyrin repeat protein
MLFAVALSIVLLAEADAGPELLAKAVRLGNVKAAEDLLEAGVNPNLPDRYGSTALYHAASMNQFDAVRLLLSYHADPNLRGGPRGHETTPLQRAADVGNVRVSSMLIAAGADVNAKGPGGRTALFFAGRRLDLMQLLIEKGAEVNVRDAEGDSPLDEAVWVGGLDATAVLLAHGARLDEAQTKSGATPINEAAYRGHANVVRYLLQFHPDLSIPDKRGFAPLDNAIRMGKEDCALLLIEGASQKTMDAAIRKKQALVVDALLRRGGDANALLPAGFTPLDIAASAGAIDVVRILLKNGADPNLSGRNGSSPLEDAALKGFATVAEVLLDHGALVNQLNVASGTTALYAAASFGKGETVRLLLERGADAALCNKGGKSPYRAALENGYKEVAEEIRSHGGESCR